MKKVLIGCGIAAAVIFVIGAGSMVWLFMSVKNTMPDTQRAERFEKELGERFPSASGYVPRTDGRLLDEIQLTRFTQLRNDLRLPQNRAAGSLDDLTGRFGADFEDGSAWHKFKTVLGSVRGGVDLAGNMVEYVTVRDSLLLEHEMGLGEFTYLNALVLFSWLEWDPVADFDQSPAVSGDTQLKEASADVLDSARRVFRKQLERLADALAEIADPSPAQEELLARLESELDTGQPIHVGFPLRGNLDADTLALLERFGFELRASLPQTFGEVVVEGANFQDIEFSKGSIRIETN